MNKVRRSVIAEAASLLRKAASMIERVADAEEEAYDNLPESIQNGERGEKMEAAIDLLEEAGDQIDDVLDILISAAV